jgi:hypothetical protein
MSVNVAAWAAAAAALISGVNLVVTTVVRGRREQTRWVRESLTDAFVAFLDASWRTTDAVKRRAVLPAGVDGDPATDVRLLARASYDDMRSQLTRLRLLASAQVRDAGEELLRLSRALLDVDDAGLGAALSGISAQRLQMIDVAKAELRL